LNPDAGDINYETGYVILRNLTASSYTGSAIKVYGRPAIQDIIGPKERIISIRAADVTVEVEAAEI
jgi:predicted membrane GTPase involved in stress response